MRRVLARSASGLRPASAFVMVGAVLAVVGARVGQIGLASTDFAGFAPRCEEQAPPDFSLFDRGGRPLAVFVRQLDLVLSPNAMWQAHTPDKMANEISRALDGALSADELLTAMLPGSTDGWLWSEFELSAAPAARVQAWIEGARVGADGESDPRAAAPLLGFELAQLADSAWGLRWNPVEALSQEQRDRQLPGRSGNPIHWSRKLADTLACALFGADSVADRNDREALEQQREDIWNLLMPSRHAVAARDFDARCASELWRTLEEQAVAAHQMSIARAEQRMYPQGELAVLGRWGFLDQSEADIRALCELGFERSEVTQQAEREGVLAALAPGELAVWQERAWNHCAYPVPVAGLELLCDRMLRNGHWDFLERRSASFVFDQHNPARQRSRRYYHESSPQSEAPRVVTTLDSILQTCTRRALEELMQQHGPAIAMAIAIDLESGDVLALDSIERYEVSTFPAVHHTFTPGSTLKAIIMAIALEAGVVGLSETFEVPDDGYLIPDSRRMVREAEGEKRGWVTPAEALAYSLNAGLVQIGMRVPAELLRARLLELGYGSGAGSGLPGERPGYLPALPWRVADAYPSVCFGHGLTTTLWQHAEALATVVRGGEHLPLRLVRAVEQDGVAYDLAAAQPRRVFSARASELVREMMVMGAREGTGSRIASPEHLPGLYIGTKTGTAQKVITEICVHAELAHQEQHAAERTRCNRKCRRSLAGQRPGHRECYTSSMCAFAAHPETGRELMVLVVADEPTGREKFGAKVAGTAAVRILKEALGVTVLGVEPKGETLAGFVLSDQPAQEEPLDMPWTQEAR